MEHCLSLLPLVNIEKLGAFHQLGQHGPHLAALPVVPEEVGQVREAGLQQHHEGHPDVVGVVGLALRGRVPLLIALQE